MTGALIKRGNLDTSSQGECHVIVKAESGGCTCKPRNAKDCPQTPVARRQAWDRFPLTVLGRNQPGVDTLISLFQAPEL